MLAFTAIDDFFFSSALHFTPSRLLKTFEDPVSRVGQPSVYEVKVSDVAPFVLGQRPSSCKSCSISTMQCFCNTCYVPFLSLYIHTIVNLNIFIRYVPHERERDLSGISCFYNYSFY